MRGQELLPAPPTSLDYLKLNDLSPLLCCLLLHCCRCWWLLNCWGRCIWFCSHSEMYFKLIVSLGRRNRNQCYDQARRIHLAVNLLNHWLLYSSRMRAVLVFPLCHSGSSLQSLSEALISFWGAPSCLENMECSLQIDLHEVNQCSFDCFSNSSFAFFWHSVSVLWNQLIY